MQDTTSLIERALILAASGEYRTASGVREALKAEGYPRPMVHPLFNGASFLKTIRTLIKSAPQQRAGKPGGPSAGRSKTTNTPAG